MVFEFQKVACLNFEHQEELEKNLITHIQSAYYRLKFQIQTENHLLDSIKENYSEVFQLTKKVIYLLENFVGVRVDDHELAYVAMHFGGWMRKEGVTLTEKRKALIVCNHGVGTSQILKSQLETLFSSLHFEVVSSSNLVSDADGIYCIFTTVRLEEAKVPIYYVNPILTDKEKERLLQSVHSLEEPTSIKSADQISSLLKAIETHTKIHNHVQLKREIEMILSEKIGVKENYKPMLNELINDSSIVFKHEVLSWQEAIELAASPLIQNESITTDYPKAMIESIENLGPYVVLAPGVAIPHARPEQGVNQLSMSLLKLDSPIAFAEGDSYQVSLIFVLAAIDNESHLKALMQLSTLLSDEQNISKLMNSTTKEDILKLINHYSTEEE